MLKKRVFFKKFKIYFFVLDQFDFLLQTAGPKLKIKWYIQVFKKVKKWNPPRKACSKVSFFDIFCVLGPFTRAKSCFSEKTFSVLRRNTATFSLFFCKKLTFFQKLELFGSFWAFAKESCVSISEKTVISGPFWEILRIQILRIPGQKGWFLGGCF